METPSETSIEQHNRTFFDSMAETWDEHMGPEHAEKLADILGGLCLESGECVLDVGAGTGVAAALIAPWVEPGGRVIMLDVALQMLVQAQTQCGEFDGIHYVQGNALRMPFASQAFNRVICNSVFPHFSDHQATVDELARVTAPAGECVVCHTSSRDEINAFHKSLGGMMAEGELPDRTTMEKLFHAAGMTIAALEDSSDHYLLRAVKAR